MPIILRKLCRFATREIGQEDSLWADYSNIGINRLETMLKMPRCPFVLYVGKKKLVKRREFEKYITDRIEIWNHCKCGFL